MPKSADDLNDYDDLSFDPITGEAQTLTDVDGVYGDEQIGADLLKDLENFEAKTASLSKSLADKTDISSLPTEKQINNTNTQKKKDSFYSSATVEKSPKNDSLVKVVLSLAITFLITAGTITYAVLSKTNENTDLINVQPSVVSSDETQTQENFVDDSNEVANFVRKSASKHEGLTIEEALATNLNVTYGRAWQILGWKVEQAEGNLYNVKFVYKQTEKKEVSWQVDLQARKLIATSLEAETITIQPSNNSNVTDGQSNQSTK